MVGEVVVDLRSCWWQSHYPLVHVEGSVMSWLGPEDNCTNPYYGVDDAGCRGGCLRLIVIAAIPWLLVGTWWWFA